MSPQNDLDRQQVSINQPVGGCYRSGSDPATCFLGDQEDASMCDWTDVDLSSKGLMCWDVIPKSGYMTKETVASSQYQYQVQQVW